MKTVYLIILFFFVSLNMAYSQKSSVNDKIKKIRQEYQTINQLPLKEITYWMLIKAKNPQWQKGKPGNDISYYILATIYFDKKGKIRKYIETGGTDDKVIKREEYFWPNGNLFFVYLEDNYVHAERGDWKLRLYFWNGKLIKNLTKKINRNTKKQSSEKYPFEIYYHKKTSSIRKEFNLKIKYALIKN